MLVSRLSDVSIRASTRLHRTLSSYLGVVTALSRATESRHHERTAGYAPQSATENCASLFSLMFLTRGT